MQLQGAWTADAGGDHGDAHLQQKTIKKTHSSHDQVPLSIEIPDVNVCVQLQGAGTADASGDHGDAHLQQKTIKNPIHLMTKSL